MSLRRLWVLVSKLGPDSRTKRVAFGEGIAMWTPEGQQRSALIYQTEHANWQRGGGKGEKPRKPKAPSGRLRLRMPDDI